MNQRKVMRIEEQAEALVLELAKKENEKAYIMNLVLCGDEESGLYVEYSVMGSGVYNDSRRVAIKDENKQVSIAGEVESLWL